MTVDSPEGAFEERELIDRARAGDRDAFGVLVRRHQRRVWLVCRQYVGPDEADAAAQETLIKAFTRLGVFDGRAAFSTWITRIAINTCLDLLRKRKRETAHRVDIDESDASVRFDLPDTRTGPEDRARLRQAVARLLQAEEGLPSRQREVFRLRFYAELSLEEIANSLGVHTGTVKTLIHRSVHRLRKELGEYR